MTGYDCTQFSLQDYLDANDPRFERDILYCNSVYNLAVPHPTDSAHDRLICPFNGVGVMDANDRIIPCTDGYVVLGIHSRDADIAQKFNDPGHALCFLLGEPLEVVETNPDSDDDRSCRVLTGSHPTESSDADGNELGDFVIVREVDGCYFGYYENVVNALLRSAPSAEAILAHVFRGYELETAAA